MFNYWRMQIKPPMQEIDLNDVTFLIPVRIDSSDRLENLRLTIQFSLSLGHSYSGTWSNLEAGMENEHFYGWGPEDMERAMRWNTLGYRINGTKDRWQVNEPVGQIAGICYR